MEQLRAVPPIHPEQNSYYIKQFTRFLLDIKKSENIIVDQFLFDLQHIFKLWRNNQQNQLGLQDLQTQLDRLRCKTQDSLISDYGLEHNPKSIMKYRECCRIGEQQGVHKFFTNIGGLLLEDKSQTSFLKLIELYSYILIELMTYFSVSEINRKALSVESGTYKVQSVPKAFSGEQVIMEIERYKKESYARHLLLLKLRMDRKFNG